VPQGAYEVQRINLEGSPKNQQLFFKIERRYPASDVLDLYNGYFRQERWIACRSSHEGWDWFLDKSSNSPQYVHQIRSYWINPDRKIFAMVGGLYYSAKLAASNVPDNSVQRWAILMQKDVDTSSETKRLSLRCSLEGSVKQ